MPLRKTTACGIQSKTKPSVAGEKVNSNGSINLPNCTPRVTVCSCSVRSWGRLCSAGTFSSRASGISAIASSARISVMRLTRRWSVRRNHNEPSG
jgi:hypothetical protein